ncbi:nitric-oxide reductase large subunit [Geobacter sp. DSM 9736]|uniref:nitric-oxide reductase large subunit n=1 Tax=Geobacter sp. DSM 9736 TaxID=1277350 RepID=UPI000B50FEEF|nr:cbb3-type cytochrome c oxidase subunit I [Geobacter sp. DSM 9736]SNB47261.1 nitric oxide reductase, NorZ apoprotein [Geobacter sp. DSM 9736]
MIMPEKKMMLSPVWLLVAVITFIAGFTILGYLAMRINREHPPIPSQVVSADGRVLFGSSEIMAGQHLFQKYGLMQYGTLFGHGAYLGPDFTAQYLHLAGEEMQAYYRGEGVSAAEAAERVRRELKNNTYDAATGTLTFSSGQARAFESMVDYYGKWFGPPQTQQGLRRPHLRDQEEIRALTSYFSWAAWTSAAVRPGTSYSYTNNWPPDPLAANVPTADALIWSVLSLVALLGGVGVILFAFGRYHWLGWHRDEPGVRASASFRPVDKVNLTPSQRATAWYFLVVAGLFLCQGLLGGVNAHYHVEPEGFYGLPIGEILAYNLSRMWHLQLALFFVASSFLAMGIFITPIIAGKEPPHQDKLALLLFGALVVVVVGSLAGEAASLMGKMPGDLAWFWVGAQGWEFLDLGRLWQMLLTVGMILWLVILVRGLKERLPEEHPGNMPWLFLYSALSIPLFYAAGMVFGRNVNFAVMDFWRFWVVHLWVEDFLELFTTIMVAYIFVLLGVVRPRVAATIVYLDIILYSVGGVIGTMHHLYFSGAPAAHMAFGAFFSAMEVIPLVLLTYEAWRFMQLGAPAARDISIFSVSTADFPHKWAAMFLVAVGFWNFLGAGVFGFLINLPIVSYYEIGTQWTANHGHGALMGVYGMLAMGFFMFVARYFIPRDRKSDLAMGCAFWSMNIGLAWMLFINLFPVGLLQLNDALSRSYWHAREPDFFKQPLVRFFEWLRFPGDMLFIVGGIFPVVYLAVRMFLNRNRPGISGSAGNEFTTS